MLEALFMSYFKPESIHVPSTMYPPNENHGHLMTFQVYQVRLNEPVQKNMNGE